MKKVNKSLLNGQRKEEIIKMIDEAKEKYKQYNEYLDRNFYENIYSDVKKLEVVVDIDIDNSIMKRLSFLANVGNINLQIKLIDDFEYRAKLIIEKLDQKKPAEKRKEEAVILESLQTYKGDKMFSLHMVDVYKKMKQQNIMNNNVKIYKKTK